MVKENQDGNKCKQRQKRQQNTQKITNKQKNTSKQTQKPITTHKHQKIFPKKAMLTQKHKSLTNPQSKYPPNKQIPKQQQKQLYNHKQQFNQAKQQNTEEKGLQIEANNLQKYEQKKQIGQMIEQGNVKGFRQERELWQNVGHHCNQQKINNLVDVPSNIEQFIDSNIDNTHHNRIHPTNPCNIPKKTSPSDPPPKQPTQPTETTQSSSATNTTTPFKSQPEPPPLTTPDHNSQRSGNVHRQSGGYTPELYLQPREESSGERERVRGGSFDQGWGLGSGLECRVLYEEDQDEGEPGLDELQQEQDDQFCQQNGQQANQIQFTNYNQIHLLSIAQQQTKNKFQPYQDRTNPQNQKKQPKKERVSDNKAKQLKKFLTKNQNCKSRDRKCGGKSSSQILISRNNDKSKTGEKKVRDRNSKRLVKQKNIFKQKQKQKDKTRNIKISDKQKHQKSKTKITDKDRPKIPQKHKSAGSPIKIRSQY